MPMSIGSRGAPGPAGPPGPAGADGIDGINGVDGADGADGVDGIDGADGADGTNGTNGADGANGATGATGPAGPTGPQGPQGPAGSDGAAGTAYNLTSVASAATATLATISVPINKIHLYRAMVAAQDTGDSTQRQWKSLEWGIQRGASGAASLISTLQTIGSGIAGQTSWTYAVVPGAVAGDFDLTVTAPPTVNVSKVSALVAKVVDMDGTASLVSTPDSIFTTRLLLWFDAQTFSTLTTSSGNVTAIADRRGGATPNVTGPVGTATYGATSLNGRPGIVAKAWYQWGTKPSSVASDYAMFFVVDVSAHGFLFDTEVGRLLIGSNYWHNGTGDSAIAGALGVQIIVFSVSGGNGTLTRYPLGSGGVGTTWGSLAYTQRAINSANAVGVGSTYVGSGPMAGKIGEVVIARAPTANEIADVVTYLRARWAI